MENPYVPEDVARIEYEELRKMLEDHLEDAQQLMERVNELEARIEALENE